MIAGLVCWCGDVALWSFILLCYAGGFSMRLVQVSRSR